MNKNKIYSALYFFHVEGKNVEIIAQQVDILPRAVEKVTKSKGFKDVEADFFSDWQQNDFTRVYEIPKEKKLDSNAVKEKKQEYLSMLEDGRADIEGIKYFLLKDNVPQSHANDIVKEIETQYFENHKNHNEDKLFIALEVQRMPEKWGIQNGKIIPVFPHPKFNSNNIVTGIEYKSHKSIFLPDELWQTYLNLQEEIESVERRRQNQFNNHTDTIAEWAMLREQGSTYADIARKFNTTAKTVSKKIKQLQEV